MKNRFLFIAGLVMFYFLISLTLASASSLVSNTMLFVPDGAAFDLFGVSADTVPNGAIRLVGASQGTSSVDPGAACFFNGTTLAQKITADDPSPGGDFGHAVVLSDDGLTAVIGAPDADGYQGAAYIFNSNSGSWVQQEKLTAPARVTEGFFGYSVDISDDGNTVIVGSWGVSAIQGAAYIFVRSGTDWSFQQQLTALDGLQYDQFGFSVALSGDGNTALIGANNDNLTPGFDYRGSAYVFVRTGSVWRQQDKLVASDGAQYDYLGNAVDLSDDGNTAIVGAAWKGAAYVFVHNGSSWEQQKKIQAVNGSDSDRFGQSVVLSNDGNIAVIGAYFANAAYMFIRQGTSWNQKQKLITNDSNASRFGSSVAVSDDGRTVLIGADSTTVSGSISQGAAYVFRPVIPLSPVNYLLLRKP